MRIRRAIISLSFAGSIVAGVAVPVATAVTSGTPVVAAASATPLVYYHL